MTNIQRIEAGSRMSEAVVHGGKVYTSGIVADSTVNQPMFEQTQEILQQIDSLLAHAGTDKNRLLKANIWLSDMAHFDQMNRAWDAWVAPACAPVRATVEAKLAAPHYRVEIMVEAAL